ncbi:MAG: 2-oxo acid dehydrogenase subunit E2 [Spirochaetales bacterium]|nr:2-oxo acid dehydrogenase subunit E2 [Spirochaetales bacterium]
MLKKTRPDGTYIEGLHHFTRMLPYMMPGRTESAIYFEQEFDVTETLPYIEKWNREHEDSEGRLTFFQVFLCGLARTVALRPDLNRFISGFNYYQRNEILLNFIAKKELTDEGEEINITVPFSPFETLWSVRKKIHGYVNRGKSDAGNESDDLNETLMKFPRFFLKFFFRMYNFLDYHNILPASLIKADPMYVTSFVTNVGSVGVDAPFHHNFERGTCGIFIALGKFKKFRYLDEAGKLQERDVVKVTYTLDDRIKDGIYCAKSIDLFKEMVENPSILENPPELEKVNLERLKLKKFRPEEAEGCRNECVEKE